MDKNIVKKIILVVIGSWIMGVGISLTIMAKVGNDPMTLFWIGIAKLFSISVGQANILVSFFILCIVLFINKKHVHIGSVLNPIVIAITTDTISGFSINSDSLCINILICIIGLLILGFGIAFYAFADYGKGAYEALVFSIGEISEKSIGKIRTLADIFFAILGIMLGAYISIGTVLAILFMGSSIQFFITFLTKMKITTLIKQI